MPKEQIIINLICGLIGALIGFAGSLYIYYLNSWRQAKERLVVALIKLKGFEFATVSGSDPVFDRVTEYKKTFPEIYGLYITYLSTIFIRKRTAERMWCKYTGNKTCEYLKELYIPVYKEEEVTERVGSLLKEIGYK